MTDDKPRDLVPIGPTSHPYTQLDQLVVYAQEEGLPVLFELLDKSADVAALLIPVGFIWKYIALKSVALAGGQIWRASQAKRLNNILSAIFETVNGKIDLLREYTADQFQVIQNDIKDILEQEYELKARYLLDVMLGYISKDKRLLKDKHLRYKRYIRDLEINELLILSCLDDKISSRIKMSEDSELKTKHYELINEDVMYDILDNPVLAQYTDSLDIAYSWQRLYSVGLIGSTTSQLQTNLRVVKEKGDEHWLSVDFFDFASYCKSGFSRKPLDD